MMRAPTPPAPPPAAVLAALLDQIACGLVLVDAQACVRYLNRAARELLDASHPLMLTGPVLQARQAGDAPRLHAALAAARQGQRRLLSLAMPGLTAEVSVVPLHAAPGGPGAANSGVLLVLGATLAAQATAIQDLAHAVGLTPAEARVLARLCAGQRPGDIARCQGVEVSTVRTQIGSARHKTGTASIRDLVRQVAVLPPLA